MDDEIFFGLMRADYTVMNLYPELTRKEVEERLSNYNKSLAIAKDKALQPVKLIAIKIMEEP